MHPVGLSGALRLSSLRDGGMRRSAMTSGSKRFFAGGAQTPVRQADGSSACPGDSSHERGASAPVINPGTSSKLTNPFACGTQVKTASEAVLLSGFSTLSRGPPCAQKARGAPV